MLLLLFLYLPPVHSVVYSPLLNKIIVYTDGASSGNPGPAGWAAIFPDEEISGAFYGTNNVAELEAIVSAIEFGPSNSHLEIRTDSMTCINWITRKWRAHQPNIARMLRHLRFVASARNVRFDLRHVRGHSGVEGNERADKLAVLERKLMARHINAQLLKTEE